MFHRSRVVVHEPDLAAPCSDPLPDAPAGAAYHLAQQHIRRDPGNGDFVIVRLGDKCTVQDIHVSVTCHVHAFLAVFVDERLARMDARGRPTMDR